MRKEIKKWGNGAGIFLSKGELELYDAKIGDIVIVNIDEVIKQKKRPKQK